MLLRAMCYVELANINSFSVTFYLGWALTVYDNGSQKTNGKLLMNEATFSGFSLFSAEIVHVRNPTLN